MADDFGFVPDQKRQDSGPSPDQTEDLGFVPEKQPVEAEDLGFVAEPEKTETGKASRARKLSRLQAGLSGAAQGISLGFSDEIMAAVSAGMDKALDTVFRPFLDEGTAALVEKPEFKKIYRQELNKARKEIEQLRKDHPAAFTAGEVTGGLASLAMPGGAVAKIAGSAAKRTASRLASAGGVGGVAGAGYSTSEDLEGVAEDVAKGAAAGVVTAGALGAAGKALRKLPNALTRKQLAAVGVKKLDKISPDEQKAIAKFARDNKIITPGARRTAENAQAVRAGALESLKQFYENPKVKEAGGTLFDKDKVARTLQAKIKEEFSTSLDKTEKDILQGIIKDLRTSSNDFQALARLRTKVGQSLRSAENVKQRQALGATYRLMSEAVEENLEALGKRIDDPALASRFKQVNQDYKMAELVARAADKAGADSSVFDRLVRAAGASPLRKVSTAATGGAAAGLNLVKDLLTDRYGASMAAKAARLLEMGGPLGARVQELADKGQAEKIIILLQTPTAINLLGE